MAPTLEHRLVSKCLEEDGEALRAALARGVAPDWFFDSQHSAAFEFIAKHYEGYGNVPGEVTFSGHMGTTYKILGVAESVEYLVDQLARSQRLDVTRRALFDAEDELKAGRVEDALVVLRTAMEDAAGFSPYRTSLVDAMHPDRTRLRWDNFLKREASGSSLMGYSTGFPTIDSATLGLQDGHLVTLVAQSKVGKTSVALAIANHIYETHEAKVLFASFEMGIPEMEMRQESLMAKVDFKHLQTGKLSPAEEKRYAEYLDKVDDEFDWPFYFMDVSSGSTVSSLQSQIERSDADVVFIDGVYMMTDEVTGEMNTPQALTNITRSLKRMAAHLQKPVFVNTQALAWKSKGVKITADSIGYSSSFLQDSDVVLGLERIKPAKGEDEETYATERILRVLASRNSGLASAEIEFNYQDGIIAESGSVVV